MTDTKQTEKPSDKKELPEPDFNGAALIDEQGNEVPITEEMLEEAFEELEKPGQKNPT